MSNKIETSQKLILFLNRKNVRDEPLCPQPSSIEKTFKNVEKTKTCFFFIIIQLLFDLFR